MFSNENVTYVQIILDTTTIKCNFISDAKNNAISAPDDKHKILCS
jgi:hypothetical protein